MLQVDLSEDGTQFILVPSRLNNANNAGNTSRASSNNAEEGPKKPFNCLLCGHNFTRRDNLANHLKVFYLIGEHCFPKL